MTLVLKDIRHSYGAVEAVSGASLDASRGEIVCIFGPSGCGKSTLLRLAAGLERLQSGSIELDGARLSGGGIDIPPDKRPVGLVFQEYVLFPHMTALENVAFGLEGRDRRKRAREELDAVGLEGLERRYPHQMSGGQQQRVALARALARRPQAMLLDEPFASIDGALRRRLREELRRLLKESGVATLLVTHDPEEALALGDRIAIMKDGRVIETAPPQSLFEDPKTPEGASLFAGSQRLECRRENGVVHTGFGNVRDGSSGDDAVILIILPGGVRIEPTPDGTATVVAVRFAGPGWLVDLAAASGQQVRAWAASPLEPGGRYSVSFDPALTKIFPAA